MSRVAYVNGRYVPHGDASVHVEDRGYQFADGVYEVVLVHNGRLVDEGPHLDRLDRSLSELRIKQPMSRLALQAIMREVVRRNRVRTGLIYMQVTRGVARRDHAFPKDATPALVITCKRIYQPMPEAIEKGVSVITIDDIRWARCDIKSVCCQMFSASRQHVKKVLLKLGKSMPKVMLPKAHPPIPGLSPMMTNWSLGRQQTIF